MRLRISISTYIVWYDAKDEQSRCWSECIDLLFYVLWCGCSGFRWWYDAWQKARLEYVKASFAEADAILFERNAREDFCEFADFRLRILIRDVE